MLANAVKQVTEMDEYKAKTESLGLAVRYMGPDEYAKYWDEKEKEVKVLVDELITTKK